MPQGCVGGVCWPLIVYMIITILALILIISVPGLDISTRSTAILISIVWTLFWGIILWWLCSRCQWTWAWILLFFPFMINVLFFIILLLAVGAFDTSGTFPNLNMLED